MSRIVLGLGANLAKPESTFREVVRAFSSELPLEAVSRLWRTRAVGPPQPDYTNAVVVVDWPRDPRSCLHFCRQREAAAGRDRARESRWGPRVLDIDLLLAEELVCRGPLLELPHPRFHERRFALEPAAEVAPDWVHPRMGRTVAELAHAARHNEPDAVLEVVDWSFRATMIP